MTRPPGPFQQGPHGQPHRPVPPAQQPSPPNYGNHPQQGQPRPPVPRQYGQLPQHFQANPQSQQATYSGLGAFQKKPSSRKKVILGSLIGVLVLAAAVIGILWGTGALGSSKIDHVAVEKGVAQVLKTSYGEQDSKGVSCPDNIDAKTGSTFKCHLKLNGQPKTVAVKIINDANDYQIGAPK